MVAVVFARNYLTHFFFFFWNEEKKRTLTKEHQQKNNNIPIITNIDIKTLTSASTNVSHIVCHVTLHECKETTVSEDALVLKRAGRVDLVVARGHCPDSIPL